MINKESNDKKTLKSPVILRRIICILCMLLVLSGAGLVVVSAAPGSGDSPTLELYKRQALDKEAFDVSNMVPGDKVTKAFTVRIHHNDPLTLYFKAEVTEQTKKLGDVLQVAFLVRGQLFGLLHDELLKSRMIPACDLLKVRARRSPLVSWGEGAAGSRGRGPVPDCLPEQGYGREGRAGRRWHGRGKRSRRCRVQRVSLKWHL